MEYSDIKRNEVLLYVSVWMNLGKKMLSGKKSGTKGYILYDSIDMKCPGK